MLKLLSCLVILLSTSCFVSAMIEKLDMPKGLRTYFDGAKMKHNISDVPGEQIFWECMQRVMWQMAEQMGHNVTRETRDYLNRLLQIAVDNADTQFPRIRKEYRMMTDEERNRFHKAIRGLKEDTSLKPNVYTAIAELHKGEVIPMAHFGAGFPGWHRVFLLIFETALRLKDPSVSIPYWASNLDSEMEDPTLSVIWSHLFFGNGDGFVTTGPFANFKLFSSDSTLTRNIGSSGTLMTNEGIHGVLSRNRTQDITNPRAPKQYNMELQHNTVHVWVGGNMDDLSTSAEDPVFFLHHSFVDYLWEEFRTRQKMHGIDPETDYPQDEYGDKGHAPNSPLGFGDLRNIDALSNVIANLVKYDPSPVCTRSHPTCISRFLRCESGRAHPVCVSKSREEVNGAKDRDTDVCVDAQLTRAVQNTFAINQYCDIRKWSYIPVKIVLQRPPEFSNYKAYPVLNNKPVMTTDVFSTVSIKKNIGEHLAAYPNCRRTNSVARKIYVESYGLNYYGKYKDFTVLDQRHALSSSSTYLGVKSPESNFTDVIVYAFDYCGRTCRPFCLDITLSPPKYTPCSGVIRITPDEPKLYGDSYAEAVNGVWSADGPDDLPQTAPNHFITFYCDFSGKWPWDEEVQRKTHKSKQQKLTKTPILRESSSINDIRKESVAPIIKSVNPRVVHNNAQIPKLNSVDLPLFTKRPSVTTIRKEKRVTVPTKRVTVSTKRVTVPIKKRLPTVLVIDLSDTTNRPPSHKRKRFLRRHLPNNQGLQEPDLFKSVLKPDGRHSLFNRRNFLDFSQQLPQQPLHRGQTMFRFHDQCRLNPSCYLTVPCSPCQHKSRQPCRTPSRMMAICVNGVYMLESVFFNFMG